MSVACVIVAAGEGHRFGGGIPKQYHFLKNKPLLQKTLDVFIDHPKITDILVVIGQNHLPLYQTHIAPHHKILPPVIGGETRKESVFAGLQALRLLAPEIVLVHDGARPFVSPCLIERILNHLTHSKACVPVIPVKETLKKISPHGSIMTTLDREGVHLAQTPQGFHYSLLLDAHECLSSARPFTDDAGLLEELGISVSTCPGDFLNTKVTYREDIAVGISDVRVGSGFDVHRLIPGDGMTLFGVFIPHSLTLEGHSDADVGLHSLTDAVLGALGEGDIGLHFPPSDPQWKGADSGKFLLDALEKMNQRQGVLNHVDITVMGETPQISSHRESFLNSLESLLGLSRCRIGLKATTTEKMGFLGRKEGLAVQSTVTLIF